MAIVYKNPHEQSHNAANAELESLRAEGHDLGERLKWIQQRTSHLEAYIAAIQPLIDDDPGKGIVDAGLTSVCRDLLVRINRWIGAGEVRVLLANLGVHLEGYTNPMAVLHATLRRVGDVRQDESGTYYGKPGLKTPVGTGYPPRLRP